MEDDGFWDSWTGMLAIVVIVVLVFSSMVGAMVVYAGTWPPLSIVESDSMQHDRDSSRLGVIDTGDLVIVRTSDGEDVVSYVEGYQTGHSSFGDHGDVIIYRPFGTEDRKPIIHRAVLWLEPVPGGWSAPSLQDYPSQLWQVDHGDHTSMSGTLVLKDYGHSSVRLEIDLDALERHAGFITHGDNNHQGGIGYVDQMGLEVGGPIKKDWVLSQAGIELPWIGSLSLLLRNVNIDQIPLNSLVMSFVVIFSVILLPFAVEYGVDALRGRRSD